MKRQRMHGTLALRRGERDEAERCFRHAIEIAQARAELSLELRAAMSLARLWAFEGRAEEARQLLGGVHGWFTEGFSTLSSARPTPSWMPSAASERSRTLSARPAPGCPSLAGGQRLQHPLIGSQRPVGAQREHADVSGAGLPVRVEPLAERVLGPPRHDGVH
jgi:hypothetical protein